MVNRKRDSIDWSTKWPEIDMSHTLLRGVAPLATESYCRSDRDQPTGASDQPLGGAEERQVQRLYPLSRAGCLSTGEAQRANSEIATSQVQISNIPGAKDGSFDTTFAVPSRDQSEVVKTTPAPTLASTNESAFSPTSNARIPKDSSKPQWWGKYITCEMGPEAPIKEQPGVNAETTRNEPLFIQVRWRINMGAFDTSCFNERKRSTIGRLSRGQSTSASRQRLKCAWQTKVSRDCPTRLLALGFTALAQGLLEEGHSAITGVLRTLPFNDGIKQDPSWTETFEAMTACMAQCATELYAKT